MRDLILDTLVKGKGESNDFIHISKGKQVREMILDISVKGSK